METRQCLHCVFMRHTSLSQYENIECLTEVRLWRIGRRKKKWSVLEHSHQVADNFVRHVTKVGASGNIFISAPTKTKFHENPSSHNKWGLLEKE
jgi:hypothetical protein